jgi:hypothetical protein
MASMSVNKRRTIAVVGMVKVDVNMAELDLYLEKYYLNSEQFSAACNISDEEFRSLIAANLVPEPSYIVTESATMKSFAFGEMPAPDARPGEYFHRDSTVWVSRAITAIASQGQANAYEFLKNNFTKNYADALKELNTNTWRIVDSFSDNGLALQAGLDLRCDTAWTYFLNGTFNLCVAHPVSEAAIANKEILQEKLSALSENGHKIIFTSAEAERILSLISSYADAAMPFSPIEYSISSRKRLVDDLRLRLGESTST